MSVTLFDATAGRFEQTLAATAGFLAKGREHCEANGIDLAELVETRMQPDMLPFRFQVVSACHHGAGALDSAHSGEFRPPPASDGMDYAALEQCVADALERVRGETAESLNARAGEDLVFHLGGNELPFVVSDFLLSFSIPNFYFHATTAYDILRMQGVPIGKRDFLGRLQMKG